jgi:hypothetical protein
VIRSIVSVSKLITIPQNFVPFTILLAGKRLRCKVDNPDKFDKLITALRTAVDNDGVLDKESTSYNDIFDAFRLALKFYHFEDRIGVF